MNLSNISPRFKVILPYKLVCFRFVENWYNVLNDFEAGFLKMKEDTVLALQDAENAGQKVEQTKYQTWRNRFSINAAAYWLNLYIC